MGGRGLSEQGNRVLALGHSERREAEVICEVISVDTESNDEVTRRNGRARLVGRAQLGIPESPN